MSGKKKIVTAERSPNAPKSNAGSGPPAPSTTQAPPASPAAPPMSAPPPTIHTPIAVYPATSSPGEKLPGIETVYARALQAPASAGPPVYQGANQALLGINGYINAFPNQFSGGAPSYHLATPKLPASLGHVNGGRPSTKRPLTVNPGEDSLAHHVAKARRAMKANDDRTIEEVEFATEVYAKYNNNLILEMQDDVIRKHPAAAEDFRLRREAMDASRAAIDIKEGVAPAGQPSKCPNSSEGKKSN